MHKSACLLLVCLLIIGCTSKNVPVQVKGRLTFGNYSFSPPEGYWYFSRKYPDKFDTHMNTFLITFFEDKAKALKKVSPDKTDVFFNFAVTKNKYKDFDEFYRSAEKLGVKYDELPIEANILKSNKDWSCKQLITSIYSIECISLGENLVSMVAFGQNKTSVLSKITLLKQMIDSVKEREGHPEK
jgi:hypothetical protein